MVWTRITAHYRSEIHKDVSYSLGQYHVYMSLHTCVTTIGSVCKITHDAKILSLKQGKSKHDFCSSVHFYKNSFKKIKKLNIFSTEVDKLSITDSFNYP